MRTTWALLGLIALLPLTAEGEAPPTPWSGQQGNPAYVNEQPRWRFDRLWPAEPTNPDAYRPLKWDARHRDWRDAEHSHGGMPRASVTAEGQVHLAAGGAWPNHRFKRMAALTYTAPTDGVFGIGGAARPRVFAGLPPLQLMLVHRSGGAAKVVKEWSLNQQEEAELGGVAVNLKKGDELSLVAAVFQNNAGIDLFLTDYRVSPSLADPLALRAVQEKQRVVAEPTPKQFDRANAQVAGGGVVFPPGVRVRNVKAYGAVGDGVHDDTAAIQAAYNKAGLIYFPNGTYLISDTITAPPRRGSAPARRIIQGQSADGVVIRLADAAPGFNRPDRPKAMIVTSYGVAQGFRNSVFNLTLEVGRDNPGAVGLDFFASNQGVVRDVTIRSLDPQRRGFAGLRLEGDNGPLLIKNLRVEGFDHGVHAAANQSATFEDIHVQDQRVCGFVNLNKATVHRLVSHNTVPAVRLHGVLNVVLDAQLRGGAGGDAISARGVTLVRDVQAEGYEQALSHDSAAPVTGDTIDEWTSLPPIVLGDAEARTLRLPIKDAPDAPWPAADAWARVGDFEPGVFGDDEPGNWAPAFQQALDAGREAVLFRPSRRHQMAGRVVIPGHVNRVFGAEAELKPPDGQTIIFETADDDHAVEPLIIERFDAIYAKLHIIHRSPRPLVVRHLCVDEIVLEPGAGDVFLDDVILQYLDIHGQNVWARQLNQEGGVPRSASLAEARPNTRNRGGHFWLLGLKTEQQRAKVVTSDGGASEAYAYILANNSANPNPIFTVLGDARASFCIYEGVLRDAPFAACVRRVGRDGRVELLSDVPRHGAGAAVPLIVVGER